MLHLFFLCSAGFLAGIVGGFIGGASMVIVPALIIFGMPPYIALATNKFVATINNAFSIFLLKRHSSIQNIKLNLKVVAPILIVSSILGAFITPILPQDAIAIVIGGLMVIFSGKALLLNKFTQITEKKPIRNQDTINSIGIYCVLFIIGIYSGAVGLAIAPIFWVIGTRYFNFEHITALTFAKIMVFIVNCSSMILFMATYDAINYKVGVIVLLCSIFGTYVATHLLLRLPKHVASPIINTLIVIMGAWLIIKELLK